VIWTEVRQILAGRDFRSLLYSRLSGQFADGLLQAALATFVLFSPERQTTPEKVAAAFAVLLIPYSIIGPFAGVLLDRWRRRTVLVRANVLRAGAVVVLMALVAAAHDGLSLGIAVLVTIGIGRFVLAGLSASLPHVVAADHLVTANSLKPTAGTIAYAMGAFTGVAVRGWAGGGDNGSLVVLGCATLMYTVAGLFPLRMPADRLGPDRAEPMRHMADVAGDFAGGARQLRRTPAAARALVIVLVNRIIFGALTIMLLLVARNRLNPVDDPDAALADFALVAAAVTVGAFAAALLTPIFGRSLGPVRWTSLAAVLAAFTVAPGLFTLALLPIALTAPFVGLSNQSAKISADTIIQRLIPDEQLGRVFSLVDVTVNVGLVMGVTIVAFTAPDDGVSSAGFVIIGLSYLTVAAWYFLSSRRAGQLRPIESGPQAR